MMRQGSIERTTPTGGELRSRPSSSEQRDAHFFRAHASLYSSPLLDSRRGSAAKPHGVVSQ